MNRFEKLYLFGIMTAGVTLFLLGSIFIDAKSNIWFWRSITGFVNLGLLWLIVSDIDLIIRSYLKALASDVPLSTEAIESKRQKAVTLSLKAIGFIILSWWLVAIAF